MTEFIMSDGACLVHVWSSVTSCDPLVQVITLRGPLVVGRNTGDER